MGINKVITFHPLGPMTVHNFGKIISKHLLIFGFSRHKATLALIWSSVSGNLIYKTIFQFLFSSVFGPH